MGTPIEQSGKADYKAEDFAKVGGPDVESPVQSFSNKDWQTARGDGAEKGGAEKGAAEKRAASLPIVGIESEKNAAAILVSDKASVEEKLKAVESMGKAGKTSLEIIDRDGSKRNLTIELEKAGARTLVHLYATDEQGKDHVILRGIKNADGSYQKQQTESGTVVASYGDWWSKNMGAKTYFTDAQNASTNDATTNYATIEGGNLFPDRRNNIVAGDSLKANRTSTGAEFSAESNANFSADFSANFSADALDKFTPRPVAAQEVPKEIAQTTALDQGEAVVDKVIPWNNRPEVKIVGDGERLNELFDGVAKRAGYARRMTQVADGAVYFRAGMAIDADGSPRARQIDPTGQSQTSLRHKGGASVNAEATNYFVLPLERYQQYGVHLGDIAAVRYGDKVRFAVFADAGPQQKLGEGSMALAASLGLSNNPRHGGTQRPEVEYIVFPGSGNGRPLHSRAHEDLGRHYLGKAYRKNV